MRQEVFEGVHTPAMHSSNRVTRSDSRRSSASVGVVTVTLPRRQVVPQLLLNLDRKVEEQEDQIDRQEQNSVDLEKRLLGLQVQVDATSLSNRSDINLVINQIKDSISLKEDTFLEDEALQDGQKDTGASGHPEDERTVLLRDLSEVSRELKIQVEQAKAKRSTESALPKSPDQRRYRYFE